MMKNRLLHQSLKTLSVFCVIALISLLFPALTQGQEPCVGLPECYEPPVIEPPIVSSDNPVVNAAPAWEGLSDGRMNPEFAEYYSVWCLDDVIRVLRGVPQTSWIDDIFIWDVMGLESGTSFVSDNGVNVARDNDVVTLSGTNGNQAPQFGSKSFSLAECIQRNGGEPQAPTLPDLLSAFQDNPPPVEGCVADDVNDCNTWFANIQAMVRAFLSICFSAPLTLVFAFGWRKRR